MKGANLHELTSQTDTFDEDIQRGYKTDPFFRNVIENCKSCKICAQAKGEYQKPVGKLHPLPIATRPWESIGMDFIGPFLEVNGHNYLWVVICRMT